MGLQPANDCDTKVYVSSVVQSVDTKLDTLPMDLQHASGCNIAVYVLMPTDDTYTYIWCSCLQLVLMSTDGNYA